MADGEGLWVSHSPHTPPPPHNIPTCRVTGEGGKYSRFLTRKEKWMLGVYTATAVTSTVIFVVTLSLIAQLQTQNETKDLQSKMANMENKLLQNQNETKDYQNKIANLENKLEEAIGKSNTRYHEMLAIGGWTKLSNGLHYKYFFQSTEISFATASEKCEVQGARLASTGIRNATIRSEMWITLSVPYSRTWIGLNQPYDNATWVWSDGKLYKDADMPWNPTDCSDKKYGAIYSSSSSTSLYCFSSTDTAWRYICEI